MASVLDPFRETEHEVMRAVRRTIAIPFVLVALGFIDNRSIPVVDRQVVVGIELDVLEDETVVLAISIGGEDVDQLHRAGQDGEDMGVLVATQALQHMVDRHGADTGRLQIEQSALRVN